VGLTNLGSESETCVGSRVRLVGDPISFEKNFCRLPFTTPLSGWPYRSFIGGEESKAKNSRVAHEYAKHREHDEFILVRAPGDIQLLV
jgi:hypothetical protein